MLYLDGLSTFCWSSYKLPRISQRNNTEQKGLIWYYVCQYDLNLWLFDPKVYMYLWTIASLGQTLIELSQGVVHG